jgi:iduronate 2-sulfatase
MRQTFFGPLIREVEGRIMTQQGETWNRELFENHLMGYALRTDRYRLVVWRDRRDKNAAPVYVELYDHKKDPHETVNVASKHPELVKQLSARLTKEMR